MGRSVARGGGFRAGRPSRSSGVSSRAGARRVGRNTQSTKGHIKEGKVVQYAVKNKAGQTTYIGSTNNPTRRAAQHLKSGKMQPSDKLQIQSRAIPRAKAEGLEKGRLEGHRRTNGRNPQHNVASDGQFHPRLF